MKNYKLYAAYGSNLNMEQMRWRCPGAKVYGTAVLKDYRLLFKGSKSGSYLTVEHAPGFEVPLGIWKTSARDEANLDRYEGYPTFYYKKDLTLQVTDLSGNTRDETVYIYIMHEDRPLGMPHKTYVDTCVIGYFDFGFNCDILREALEVSAQS